MRWPLALRSRSRETSLGSRTARRRQKFLSEIRLQIFQAVATFVTRCAEVHRRRCSVIFQNAKDVKSLRVRREGTSERIRHCVEIHFKVQTRRSKKSPRSVCPLRNRSMLPHLNVISERPHIRRVRFEEIDTDESCHFCEVVAHAL